MQWPFFATAIGSHAGRELSRPEKLIRRNRLGASSRAAVLLVVGLVCTRWPGIGAGADEPPRADGTAGPPPAASQSDFLAEIRRNLKTQHERVVELSREKMPASLDPEPLADQLVNQQITTKSAEANCENAKLEREVAEISVAEYTEGTCIQDKATIEGEIRLAESDLDRKRTAPEILQDQIARIQRASKGSAYDLWTEFQLRDGIIQFQREERKAQLELEKAKSKLRMLVDYTQPIRLRELRAAVETARSSELAKRAAFEIERAKEARLAAAVAAYRNGGKPGRRGGVGGLLGMRMARAVPGDQDRILASLQDAISVEEQLRAKLNEITKQGTQRSADQKEISDLARRLQAIIDDAEAKRAALQFDRLKARIHRAGTQPGVPTK